MSDSIPRARDSLRRSMTLSVGALIAQFPFSIVGQLLAPRVVGVSEYGVFGYFQTGVLLILPLLSLPAVFGMPMYVAKHPSEARRAHLSLLVSLGFGVLVGTMGSPVWSWLSTRLPGVRPVERWDMAVLVFTATAVAYRNGVELLFVGQQDFARRGLVVLTHPVLFAVIAASLYLMGVKTTGYSMFLWWAGSLVVCALISSLLLVGRLSGPGGWCLETSRRLAVLGAKGALVNFAFSWLYRTPFLVAERRLSPVILGLWTGIHTLAEMARRVTAAIGGTLIPFAARQSTKRTVIVTVQALSAIALVGYVIVWFFRSSLTPFLFGAEFTDPHYLLVVAYPGIVASCLGGTVIAQALAGWGYPPTTYVAPILSTVLGIVLWSMPKSLNAAEFGVVFSVTQIVCFVAHAVSYQRGEGIRASDWFRFSQLGRAIRVELSRLLGRKA